MNHSIPHKPCIFCDYATENPVEMGQMLTYKNITAHTYCLLLSSNLTQNGKDDDGMLGFLRADIKIEVKRAAQMICCYCKRYGASIGCCHKKCHKAFHLPCAIERDCLFEFTDTFRSFCHAHHGIKKPKRVHSVDDKCSICLENMGNYAAVRSVRTPCCSMWFHKKCLMETANSAGYFFKCPLCNNKDIFREKLVYCGIFIPDKDAAWEEQPDAYAELRERPTCCTAKICKCPHGRDFNAKTDNAKFSLIYCNYCGSHCVHKHCNASKKFVCTDCLYSGHNDKDTGNLTDEKDADQDCVIVLDGCDVAGVELNSPNMRRIELEDGSHGSTENSNSATSSFDWLKSDRNWSQVLVHTTTSCSQSCSSSSDNTSTHAVDFCSESDDDDENEECIRSIGLNRSTRIYSDDDEGSNNDSDIIQPASNTMHSHNSFVTSADDTANEDRPNGDDDKRPVGQSQRNCCRISDDNLQRLPGTKSITTQLRSIRKRKRSSSVIDSTSDDESLIENQNFSMPTKKIKFRLSNLNNNNTNAGTPLMEDNWNQKIVKIS